MGANEKQQEIEKLFLRAYQKCKNNNELYKLLENTLKPHIKHEANFTNALFLGYKILSVTRNIRLLFGLCEFLSSPNYNKKEQEDILGYMLNFVDDCPNTIYEVMVLLNFIPYPSKLKVEMVKYTEFACGAGDANGKSVSVIFNSKEFQKLVQDYDDKTILDMVWHIGRTGRKQKANVVQKLFELYNSGRFKELSKLVNSEIIATSFGYIMENIGDVGIIRELSKSIESKKYNQKTTESMVRLIGTLAWVPLKKDHLNILLKPLSDLDHDPEIVEHIMKKLISAAQFVKFDEINLLTSVYKSKEFTIFTKNFDYDIVKKVVDSFYQVVERHGNQEITIIVRGKGIIDNPPEAGKSQQCHSLLDGMLVFYNSGRFLELSNKFSKEDLKSIIKTINGIVCNSKDIALLNSYADYIQSNSFLTKQLEDINRWMELSFWYNSQILTSKIFEYYINKNKKLLKDIEQAIDLYKNLDLPDVPISTMDEIRNELLLIIERNLRHNKEVLNDAKELFRKYPS